MKMSDETKQKMARQRKERKKEFFNNFDIGSVICFTDVGYVCPRCAYILGRHEHRGGYYYVLGTADGDIFIGKVVYSVYVDVIKVLEHTKKYAENKEVFDSWMKSVKEKRERAIREYYTLCDAEYIWVNNADATVLGTICGNGQMGSFRRKKEYDGKYYFVLGIPSKEQKDYIKYVVAKLVWYDHRVELVMITDKEFEENKEEFEIWIQEARKKT